MKLNWVNNEKIFAKELWTPYRIKRDIDYYDALKAKYDFLEMCLIESQADEKSLEIIRFYRDRILTSVELYYEANISDSNDIIMELIKDLEKDKIAISLLNESDAFPGLKISELQFFRSRLGSNANSFTSKEMMYLPLCLRSKSGNYRFSIQGNPSLYLSNSSYGCWIETGCPSDSEFNVSPVVLDGNQKILNLAVMTRDLHMLNEFEEERVHCWLKLIMLSIATSFVIEENNRSFKSEYILSQSIMMACKRIGLDGVAYYSKRVDDEVFSVPAINLALFVSYKNEKEGIGMHMKIGDSFNYGLFKQLDNSLKYKDYELRSTRMGRTTNIGTYKLQFPYNETLFYSFDKFLFANWDKNNVEWGHVLK